LSGESHHCEIETVAEAQTRGSALVRECYVLLSALSAKRMILVFSFRHTGLQPKQPQKEIEIYTLMSLLETGLGLHNIEHRYDIEGYGQGCRSKRRLTIVFVVDRTRVLAFISSGWPLLLTQAKALLSFSLRFLRLAWSTTTEQRCP
jgi:hypothetical protein